MATSLNLHKLILLLNIPLSVYTLLYLGSQDGLLKRMRTLAQPGRHGYPGTSAPLRKFYTGLPPVDRQLTVLVALFAEAIDPARPATIIRAVHFAAQFGVAGLLLALEAARRGNRGTGATWATFFGNLAQNASFAIAAPSYFLLHLIAAPLTSTEPTGESIAISPAFAASIPLSFTFGYLVPTVILMLPAPKVLSYDSAQIVNAVWQLFPCYIALLQILFQPLLTTLFPQLRSSSVTPTSRAKLPLRLAYLFGIILAALGHISTTGLWVLHLLTPSLFARAFPTFRSVFVPSVFWPKDARRVKSIAEAASLLLHWDEICGGLATLVWAAAVLQGGMAMTGRRGPLAIVGTLFSVLLGAALLGPCGAAVGMVWARDEMIWEAEAQLGRKNQ